MNEIAIEEFAMNDEVRESQINGLQNNVQQLNSWIEARSNSSMQVATFKKLLFKLQKILSTTVIIMRNNFDKVESVYKGQALCLILQSIIELINKSYIEPSVDNIKQLISKLEKSEQIFIVTSIIPDLKTVANNIMQIFTNQLQQIMKQNKKKLNRKQMKLRRKYKERLTKMKIVSNNNILASSRQLALYKVSKIDDKYQLAAITPVVIKQRMRTLLPTTRQILKISNEIRSSQYSLYQNIDLQMQLATTSNLLGVEDILTQYELVAWKALTVDSSQGYQIVEECRRTFSGVYAVLIQLNIFNISNQLNISTIQNIVQTRLSQQDATFIKNSVSKLYQILQKGGGDLQIIKQKMQQLCDAQLVNNESLVKDLKDSTQKIEVKLESVLEIAIGHQNNFKNQLKNVQNKIMNQMEKLQNEFKANDIKNQQKVDEKKRMIIQIKQLFDQFEKSNISRKEVSDSFARMAQLIKINGINQTQYIKSVIAGLNLTLEEMQYGLQYGINQINENIKYSVDINNLNLDTTIANQQLLALIESNQKQMNANIAKELRQISTITANTSKQVNQILKLLLQSNKNKDQITAQQRDEKEEERKIIQSMMNNLESVNKKIKNINRDQWIQQIKGLIKRNMKGVVRRQYIDEKINNLSLQNTSMTQLIDTGFTSLLAAYNAKSTMVQMSQQNIKVFRDQIQKNKDVMISHINNLLNKQQQAINSQNGVLHARITQQLESVTAFLVSLYSTVEQSNKQLKSKLKEILVNLGQTNTDLMNIITTINTICQTLQANGKDMKTVANMVQSGFNHIAKNMNSNQNQLNVGIKFIIQCQNKLKEIVYQSNQQIQRQIAYQHYQTNNLIVQGVANVNQNQNNNAQRSYNQIQNLSSNLQSGINTMYNNLQGANMNIINNLSQIDQSIYFTQQNMANYAAQNEYNINNRSKQLMQLIQYTSQQKAQQSKANINDIGNKLAQYFTQSQNQLEQRLQNAQAAQLDQLNKLSENNKNLTKNMIKDKQQMALVQQFLIELGTGLGHKFDISNTAATKAFLKNNKSKIQQLTQSDTKLKAIYQLLKAHIPDIEKNNYLGALQNFFVQFQSDKNKIKNEKKQIESNIEIKEERQRNLIKQIKQHQEKCLKLQSDIKLLKQKQKSNQQKIAQFEVSTKYDKQKILQLEAIKTKSQSNQSSIQSYKSTADQLSRQKFDLQTKCNSIIQQKNKMQSDLKAQIQQLTDKKNQLQAKNGERHKQNNKLENQAEKLKQKNQFLKKEIERLKVNINQQKISAQSKEKQQSKLNLQKMQEQKAMNEKEIKYKIDEIKKLKEEKQDTVDNLEKEINKLKKNIKQIQQNLTMKDEQIKKLNKSISTKNEEAAILTAEIKTLKKGNADQMENLQKLEIQLKKMKTASETKIEEEKMLTKKATLYEVAQKTLKQKQQLIASKQKKIKQLQTARQLIIIESSQAQANKRELLNVKSEIAELKIKCQRLQTQNLKSQQNKVRLEEVNNRLSTKQTEYNELKKINEQNLKKAQQVKANISKLTLQKTKLQDKIKSSEDNEAKANVKVVKIQEQFNTQKKKIQQKQQDFLKKQKDNKTEFQKAKTKLQAQINKIKEEKNSLQNNLAKQSKQNERNLKQLLQAQQNLQKKTAQLAEIQKKLKLIQQQKKKIDQKCLNSNLQIQNLKRELNNQKKIIEQMGKSANNIYTRIQKDPLNFSLILENAVSDQQNHQSIIKRIEASIIQCLQLLQDSVDSSEQKTLLSLLEKFVEQKKKTQQQLKKIKIDHKKTKQKLQQQLTMTKAQVNSRTLQLDHQRKQLSQLKAKLVQKQTAHKLANKEIDNKNQQIKQNKVEIENLKKISKAKQQENKLVQKESQKSAEAFRQIEQRGMKIQIQKKIIQKQKAQILKQNQELLKKLEQSNRRQKNKATQQLSKKNEELVEQVSKNKSKVRQLQYLLEEIKRNQNKIRGSYVQIYQGFNNELSRMEYQYEQMLNRILSGEEVEEEYVTKAKIYCNTISKMKQYIKQIQQRATIKPDQSTMMSESFQQEDESFAKNNKQGNLQIFQKKRQNIQFSSILDESSIMYTKGQFVNKSNLDPIYEYISQLKKVISVLGKCLIDVLKNLRLFMREIKKQIQQFEASRKKTSDQFVVELYTKNIGYLSTFTNSLNIIEDQIIGEMGKTNWEAIIKNTVDLDELLKKKRYN